MVPLSLLYFLLSSKADIFEPSKISEILKKDEKESTKGDLPETNPKKLAAIEKSISEFLLSEIGNKDKTIDDKNKTKSVPNDSSTKSPLTEAKSSIMTKIPEENLYNEKKYWTTIMNENKPEKVLIGVRTITVVESILKEKLSPIKTAEIQIESVLVTNNEDKNSEESKGMASYIDIPSEIKSDKITKKGSENIKKESVDVKPNIIMSILGNTPSSPLDSPSTISESSILSKTASSTTTSVSKSVSSSSVVSSIKAETQSKSDPSNSISAASKTSISIIPATITEITSDAFSVISNVKLNESAGSNAKDSLSVSASSSINGLSTVAPIRLSYSTSLSDKNTHFSKIPASTVPVTIASESSIYSVAPNSSRSADETSTKGMEKNASNGDMKTIGNNKTNNNDKSIKTEVGLFKKLGGDKPPKNENIEISSSTEEKVNKKGESSVSNFIDVLREISEGKKNKEKVFVDGKVQAKTKDGKGASKFSFEGWVMEKGI